MEGAHRLFSLAGALAALIAIPAVPAPASARPEAPFDAVVRGSNAFAADLHRRLATGPWGNRFASPGGIYMALVMAHAGARGETAAEMERVLRLPSPGPKSDAAAGEILRILRRSPQRGPAGGDSVDVFRLSVANALWGQRGRRFEPAFLEVMEREYEAGFREVDFVKAAEEARGEINAWTAEQTRDRIREIVPPGAVGPLTRLVLTNAVYFKDAWFHPFFERATTDLAFHLAGGDSVRVPTMTMNKDFAYMEDDRVQVVELPYRSAEVSAFVVLPRERDGIHALERTLSAGDLARWTGDGRESRKVDLHLPRFRFTSEFELSDALRDLGIAQAFTGEADFSGITVEERLFISAVLHKAFVAVDEKGTEAAAATAVVFAATSMPAPAEPVAFHADHPFLFLIRHNASGLILFLGRIADPREE